MIFDDYDNNRMTGGIIFIDILTNITVGAKIIRINIKNQEIILPNHLDNFKTNLHAFISQYFPHWQIKTIGKK